MRAVLTIRANIADIKKDPASYDFVIVSPPLWSQNVSNPVLTSQQEGCKNGVLFCTCPKMSDQDTII
jgi:hypothetical protein